MKKYLIGAIVGATLTLPLHGFAETALQEVTAYLRPELPILMDGKKLELKNPPLIYDGSTYLPLKDIAGIIGKEAAWNEQTQSVEVGELRKPDTSKIVELRNYVPGYSANELDPAAISLDGVVFLNMTAAARKYNVQPVKYDSKTRTISFEGTGINVFQDSTDVFSAEADIVAYNNSPYVKEDILQKVSTINDARSK